MQANCPTDSAVSPPGGLLLRFKCLCPIAAEAAPGKWMTMMAPLASTEKVLAEGLLSVAASCRRLPFKKNADGGRPGSL